MQITVPLVKPTPNLHARPARLFAVGPTHHSHRFYSTSAPLVRSRNRPRRRACQRRHKYRSAKASVQPSKDSSEPLDPEQRPARWSKTTTALASAASAVFLILLLPQILVNSQNIASNDFAALSAVAWVVSGPQLPIM